VRKLYGPDALLKWKIGAAVAFQVFAAWLASGMPWGWALLFAYAVGGVVNHALTLGMHEVSHNLAFRAPAANRLFGIFTNLPLGVPSFVSFKRYHMEHHNYQGEDGVDMDIPTPAEGRIFTNALAKAAWCVMQPGFYALRPVLCLPKPPTAWEGANFAVQAAFDYAVFAAFGAKGLAYLVVGTLLGMGLHPMAGHFIAEHYTFHPGQETYSYYGPLNWLSFNVGYHNEHHDFPFIPGSRLPALRAMAPEFYDALPHHNSWVLVIARYISDAAVGPFSRVKRATLPPAELAELRGAGGIGEAR